MKENFIMIEKQLKTFMDFQGCITFPASAGNDIIRVNKFLAEHDFAVIPEEYLQFLKLSNGLSYNGIEFFGTINHYREEKKYTFPDLIATNMHYEGYAFFNNKIIIGRISENLMFYDKITENYAIADRLTLRSRREVTSFGELLDIFLGICSY